MKQTAGERIAEEWGRGVLPGTVAQAIDAALATQKQHLQGENERLLELLRKATKAMCCCTIIGFGKEHDPASEFCRGALYAIEAANRNIWEALNAPDGKRDYIWWERQIDPNVKFVDGDGKEIQYPSREPGPK